MEQKESQFDFSIAGSVSLSEFCIEKSMIFMRSVFFKFNKKKWFSLLRTKRTLLSLSKII